MNFGCVPILIFLALIFGMGCQATTLAPVPDTPVPQLALPTTAATAALPTPLMKEKTSVGYTYIRPDGNRVVEGRGSMPDIQPIDISLDGEPRWVVAAPTDGGSLWIVTLDDGRVQSFQVSGREVTEVAVSPDRLPAGMPPALSIHGYGE
ncbi:MAG: hypothetical protein IIC24_09830, partial [Chloroflexi bacterium]|nr:hypothetical protein [Chloroflexota bacterium]